MTDAGFFKGTSTDQDARFADKKKKLMKSMKFGENLEKKVDMTKVNLETLRPWIVKRITELLSFEDEVVCDYIFNQLEEIHPDPKDIQINITGFLNSKNARIFVTELWDLLLSAMETPGGVPAIFLEAKKAELSYRKEEENRIQSELAIKEADMKRAIALARSSATKTHNSLGHKHQPLMQASMAAAISAEIEAVKNGSSNMIGLMPPNISDAHSASPNVLLDDGSIAPSNFESRASAVVSSPHKAHRTSRSRSHARRRSRSRSHSSHRSHRHHHSRHSKRRRRNGQDSDQGESFTQEQNRPPTSTNNTDRSIASRSDGRNDRSPSNSRRHSRRTFEDDDLYSGPARAQASSYRKRRSRSGSPRLSRKIHQPSSPAESRSIISSNINGSIPQTHLSSTGRKTSPNNTNNVSARRHTSGSRSPSGNKSHRRPKHHDTPPDHYQSSSKRPIELKAKSEKSYSKRTRDSSYGIDASPEVIKHEGRRRDRREQEEGQDGRERRHRLKRVEQEEICEQRSRDAYERETRKRRHAVDSPVIDRRLRDSAHRDRDRSPADYRDVSRNRCSNKRDREVDSRIRISRSGCEQDIQDEGSEINYARHGDRHISNPSARSSSSDLYGSRGIHRRDDARPYGNLKPMAWVQAEEEEEEIEKSMSLAAPLKSRISEPSTHRTRAKLPRSLALYPEGPELPPSLQKVTDKRRDSRNRKSSSSSSASSTSSSNNSSSSTSSDSSSTTEDSNSSAASSDDEGSDNGDNSSSASEDDSTDSDSTSEDQPLSHDKNNHKATSHSYIIRSDVQPDGSDVTNTTVQASSSETKSAPVTVTQSSSQPLDIPVDPALAVPGPKANHPTNIEKITPKINETDKKPNDRGSSTSGSSSKSSDDSDSSSGDEDSSSNSSSDDSSSNSSSTSSSSSRSSRNASVSGSNSEDEVKNIGEIKSPLRENSPKQSSKKISNVISSNRSRHSDLSGKSCQSEGTLNLPHHSTRSHVKDNKEPLPTTVSEAHHKKPQSESSLSAAVHLPIGRSHSPEGPSLPPQFDNSSRGKGSQSPQCNDADPDNEEEILRLRALASLMRRNMEK